MSRSKKSVLPALLPNATKHGAFSKIALFPGDDPEEFQRFRSAVLDEYRPNGPSEEDAVATITMCMWRKRRVEVYIAAKAAEGQNSREQMARSALGTLRLEPDSIVRILSACAPDIREQIEKKFPRSNHATESEWNGAVRDHLELVLRGELIPPDGEAVPEPAQLDWTTLFFPPCSTPSELTDEQLIGIELRGIERLEARIDHAVRRLMQIKTMKHLMSSADLHLYAREVITVPSSTSRTRKGGITQGDLD